MYVIKAIKLNPLNICIVNKTSCPKTIIHLINYKKQKERKKGGRILEKLQVKKNKQTHKPFTKRTHSYYYNFIGE